MTARRPRSHLPTHAVTNQPPARTSRNLWAEDLPLQQALAANRGRKVPVERFGAALGAEDIQQAGRDANRYTPELVLFDRAGRRLDEVRFHPSYHRLMDLGLRSGISSIAWENQPGGHVTHAAMIYLMGQVEPGVCCPMTMTYAAVPALDANADLAAKWRPKLLTRGYDPACKPLAEKSSATLGMAMTEKQGGSDVRANSTVATPDGDSYRLRGHKWFCSAPMCDGFLTLAYAPDGLTCFLVPRWQPDGSRNPIHLMRLKDKLGNRANASAEIEYHDAFAERLGNEGDGVKTIVKMVHHTRLDTAVAPAGLMRAALSEALWWAGHRSAFQKTLIDQPLMRNLLADLALDVEGALAVVMRVARAYDDPSPEGQSFARIAVALVKFLNNKRAPNLIYEAMEALGGIGYVEETPMPLLYREAPLNSIWEGSGNIICLDVLRTLSRDALAVETLRAELLAATGGNRLFDIALKSHFERWPSAPPEAQARWYTERLGILLTAATLLQTAPDAVAEAYVITRVAQDHGSVAGAVEGLDTGAILGRVLAEAG